MKVAAAVIAVGLIWYYGVWGLVAVLLAVIAGFGYLGYGVLNLWEAMTSEIAVLKEELEAANRHIENLKRSRPGRSEDGPSDRIFAMVSLHPKCTQEVFEAVRRDFRRRLHPDAHPPNKRAQVTKEFQRYEVIFDQISRRRQF